MFLLIISSLVFSKKLYCSSVWSNTSATYINKIQSIQNFACKIVTNSMKHDHVTPLLRQLNWLFVKQLPLFGDSVMAYKCFNGLAPSYLCSKFSNALIYTIALLASAIRFKFPYFKQLQANVLSQAFGSV